MNKTLLATASVALAAIVWFAAKPDQNVANATTRPSALAEGAPLAEVILPDQLSPQAQMGETAFASVCAACHGDNASGRNGFGPPLVHKIYEPGHHGDMSFFLAVQNGVQSHHWPFGDMPPQQGLTRSDVSNIVAYVREVQRANGID